MAIERIYAQLNCDALSRSESWFATVFNRPPDARPMQGLVEWRHGDGAGLQLFEDSENAGRGTLTLIVSDLKGERTRLVAAGWEVAGIQPADTAKLLMLRDPDNNQVVLAEPNGR